MRPVRLLLDEIAYRKTSFFLSVFAVTVASALFVAGPTLIDAYGRATDAQLQVLEAKNRARVDRLTDETRKLMRDMGFNLMIVHRDTDMTDFWADDFATVDMPQEYVDRLAKARNITLATHLVATLQQKIEWNRRKILLVGYLPETPQAHKAHKTPMGYAIERGTALVGYELGHDLETGDTIEVLGKPLRVAGVLGEKGSKEDITLAIHLSDAQEMLDKKGRVNQILALGCKCAGSRLPKVREQLSEVLPDTQITEFRSIALARAEQRELVAREGKESLETLATSRADTGTKLERLTAVTTPVVVIACALWVGLLALGNVRERRGEIGILRALGVGSGKVASLFLGKAVILGLLGGVLGFICGDSLARSIGSAALGIDPASFSLAVDVAVYTVVGAPAISALASWLPTLFAVVEDPAEILRETV